MTRDVREAASALARGDGLGALSRIGRGATAAERLLKAIAYAQIGDLELARKALALAELDADDALLRARITAASAEITLAEGDAARAAKEAEHAAELLASLGDERNASMEQLVVARAEVLVGRLGDARRRVDDLLARALDVDVRGVALLASAEIAVRERSASRARARLDEARACVADSGNALLERTLASFTSELARPIARLVAGGDATPADLAAIEDATSGEVFLVDACRRLAIAGRATVRLEKKPALFALLRVLAQAWPGSVARDELAAAAFEVKRPNASHRSRLRVEIGRLRKLLAGVAEPVATKDGYVLEATRPVRLLLPPTEDADANIALLLADGAAWSARAIAEHANVSKRTALRALASLVDGGRAARVTNGRDVRYVGVGPAIASRLLLLGLVARS